MTGEVVTADAIAAEIAEIRPQLADRSSPYWRDDGVTQRRFLALIEARENGEAPAGPSEAARSFEAVRAEGRADPALWRDEAFVARYQAAQAAVAEPGPDLLALDIAGFVQAGGHSEDFEIYETISTAAKSVVAAAPPVQHSFHGLPAGVQQAALAALGDPRPVEAEPLSAAALGALPAPVKVLGADTLGRASARLWRAVDGMGDTEARAALRWLDRLPQAAQVAVFKTLGRRN